MFAHRTLHRCASLACALALTLLPGCLTPLDPSASEAGLDASGDGATLRESDASTPRDGALDASTFRDGESNTSDSALADAVSTTDAGPARDATPTADVVPAGCVGTAASCSQSVYDRAVAFANANPTRPVSHGTWNQYCAALMYWFGGFGTSALTATAAYNASSIVSRDPTTAPIGAFHYWSLPGSTAGHVGVDLLGQGAVVFMASTHLAARWGTSGYVGVNSVATYSESANATYLGWAMEFNGHGQRLAGGGACGAATVPAGCTIPRSPTQTTGAPDAAFVMRLQLFARANGYTGAINGQSDAATWAKVQLGLRPYGYSGPANGLPGTNSYRAFQTLARDRGGYTGPINGVLDPNSFRGFARFLNETY